MTDTSSCAANEKQVAWGGLSLSVPEEWEPGLLGPETLRLDHRSGPALELKWSELASFDPARQVDKVAKNFKTVRFMRTGQPGLPPDWRRAVEARASKRTLTEPFAWYDEERATRGLGAAVYFRKSATAVLVQFFLSPGDESCELPARVLASLSDHGTEETTPWAVFGLRAEVPARFRLASQSFKPGHFSLEFKTRKTGLLLLGKPAELVLERFGPASVLLGPHVKTEGGSPLSLWAKGQYKKALPGEQTLESPPELLRLSGKGSARLLRLDEAANKILAATLTRAGKNAPAELDDIFKRYETA